MAVCTRKIQFQRGPATPRRTGMPLAADDATRTGHEVHAVARGGDDATSSATAVQRNALVP